MEDAVILHVGREHYSIEECNDTMTIGELIDYLKGFNEDWNIYTCVGGGVYDMPVYDGISCWDIVEKEEEEE